MNKKTTGPMEKIHAAFEAIPEQESIEDTKADLRAIGINPDTALQRFQKITQQKLKEHRLAWMEKVPDQKAAFTKAKTAVSGALSWIGRKPEEIVAAFDQYIAGQDLKTAMAFRNKKDLSIEDKAKILDSIKILKAEKDDPK